MATDDVHDLFDRDDDGSDDSADDERDDASTGASTRDDDRSLGDEEPEESTGSTRDGAADSTTTSGGDDGSASPAWADDVQDLFGSEQTEEPDPTTSADDESDATDGSARPDGFPSSDESVRTDDVAGAEPDESPVASGGAAEDDRGALESGGLSPSSGQEESKLFGEFGSSESTPSGAEGPEDDPGGVEPSKTASGPSDDGTGVSESPDASTTDSRRDDEHERDAPDSGAGTSGTSVGDEADVAESPDDESGAFETAAPTTSTADDDDDDDSSESSGATIFSNDVDAEERDGSSSVDADPVGEESTAVDGPPSGTDGIAGSTKGATASSRTGGGSSGSTETAEAPPLDDSAATDPDGETAAAGGTTPDDLDASSPTGEPIAPDDGFVTASPTEPDGPVVDEEAAASSLSESGRLSTGIDVLDEAMGGGVPPGRLVVLVADPGVQSELIVDSVLTQRDTLYVTTDRPDWEVQKDVEPGLGSGEIAVQEHRPDSLLSGVDSLLDEIGTTANFVLDSVNELELVERGRYRIFLSDVKRRLFQTGSIGLLTGVTVDHESARDLTLRRADIVWRIETRTTGGDLEHWLSVPKFRGGAAMSETVKLELTDEVRVDPEWQDR